MNCSNKKQIVPVILGTDWWSDCDDVVAVRVLTWAQEHELVKICGINIDACMHWSAPSLDAFLRAEGLSEIPIGIDISATDYPGNCVYQKWLAEHPHRFDKNEDYEDSVRLYRRILAKSQQPVSVIEIGFGPVLAHLLNSPPDDISPLSGKELVKQKVNKLWWMAGKWDEPVGIENNFSKSEAARLAAHKLCLEWPTPITFLGFEVGVTVITGGTLTSKCDLLKGVMALHGCPEGRCSWDPMLVLMACIGDEKTAGYDQVFGTASVDAKTGENRFRVHSDGQHSYVIKCKPDSYYQDAINHILEEREQF